jgi:hypothetical protein
MERRYTKITSINRFDRRDEDLHGPRTPRHEWLITLDIVAAKRLENALNASKTEKGIEISEFLSLGNVAELLAILDNFLESEELFALFVETYYRDGCPRLAEMLLDPYYKPYFHYRHQREALEIQLLLEGNKVAVTGMGLRSVNISIEAKYDLDAPSEILGTEGLNEKEKEYLTDQINLLHTASNQLQSMRLGVTMQRPDLADTNSEVQTWLNYALATFCLERNVPILYSANGLDETDQDRMLAQILNESEITQLSTLPLYFKHLKLPFYAKFTSPWRNLGTFINLLHVLSAVFGEGKYLNSEQLELVAKMENAYKHELAHAAREAEGEGLTLSQIMRRVSQVGIAWMAPHIRLQLLEEISERLVSAEISYARDLILFWNHLLETAASIGVDSLLEKVLLKTLIRLLRSPQTRDEFMESYFPDAEFSDAEMVSLPEGQIEQFYIPAIALQKKPNVAIDLQMARHIVGAVREQAVQYLHEQKSLLRR